MRKTVGVYVILRHIPKGPYTAPAPVLVLGTKTLEILPNLTS